MKATPTSVIVAAVAAALLPAGGCYLLGPDEYHESYSLEWRGGDFGCASVGCVAWAGFFGELKGVSPGQGFTVSMPPLLPVQTLAVTTAAAAGAAYGFVEGTVHTGPDDPMALVVVPVTTVARAGQAADKVASEVMPPESLNWGVTDPQGKFISEFSLNLGLSHTTHVDEEFGGMLRHIGVLLGVRLAGPRRARPRLYVDGGVGWYWLDYDNRSDASVPGAHVGAGAEFLRGDEKASVMLEYRAHFYLGEDEEGEALDGGAHGLAVVLGFYW